MEGTELIEIISQELNKYPHITYYCSTLAKLTIKRNSIEGFDIILETGVRENTLYFDSFHFHYENNDRETEELFNQIVMAIFGYIRIKVFSKKGHEYKWQLQKLDEEGNWYDDATMSIINLDVFSETEVTYLRNTPPSAES
ncbi:hypothetical protein ACR79R_06015 [Sphingobacterium spiritivorum]|uniref:hypothetical protein n=1 Tax=Sphingobacterium spiritivorum TaxID=258 RepID=UPI003DA67A3A